MTIKDMRLAIIKGLDGWAKSYGAKVLIAHDQPHLFFLLGQDAGKARACVMFYSQMPRNEQHSDQECRMDNRFWIVISRGYSLESYPGKNLVEGIAGGAPLDELIEEARDAVWALEFDAPGEPRPYYKGTLPMDFPGVTLDASRIMFEIATEAGYAGDEP